MTKNGPVFNARLDALKCQEMRSPATWLSIAAIASFAVFYLEDRRLVHDRSTLDLLLQIRIGISFCLSIVLFLTWKGPASFAGRWSGISTYVITATGVSWVTSLCGGGTTRYHEALCLSIFAFGAFIPATLAEVSVLGSGLIASHHWQLLRHDALGSPELAGSNFLAMTLCLVLSCIGVGVVNNHRARELRASIERDRLIDDLNTKNVEKDKGIANISNELRTPLSLIRVPLDAFLKKRRNLDEPGRRQLEGCYENTRRLAVLVDEMVDLISYEGTKPPLRLSTFNLADMLKGLVAQVSEPAHWLKIELAVRIEENAGLEVVADRRLLDRVCLNLLANALKFTDENGTVTIGARKEAKRVSVWVQDTGIGIKPEDTERIFRPYVQVETTDQRRKGGVGLGLTLSRQMVEQHRGELLVESVFGKGSTFSFWLPASLGKSAETRELMIPFSRTGSAVGLEEWGEEFRARDEYRLQQVRRVADRRAVRRTAPPDAQKILVVDEDEGVVQMFNSLLEGEYNLYKALDGKSGLLACEDHRPDLVICSVCLPRMTGDEMVRELRRTKFGATVPVIALVSEDIPSEKRDMEAARVDGFLSRGFEIESLLNIVDAHLTRQAEAKSAAEDERWAALRLQAGSAAHEVLNPLQAVSNKFFFIEDELTEAEAEIGLSEATKRVFGNIANLNKAAKAGVERAVKAVETLQRLSRGTEDEEPFTTSFVTPLIQVVLTVVDSQHAIECDLTSMRPFFGQRDAFSRVMINLIKNAQEACQNSTTALIRVRAWDDDAADRIYITVKDNGPGISKEAQAKIFDPWYTTKQLGTGLGLHVCREVIARHKGLLLVDSDINKGATFTVVLPASSVHETIQNLERRADGSPT